MSASDPLILPLVTIDPTFPIVIQDVHSGVIPSEKFWISCYKASHPSVHAKILAELDDRDRDLVQLKPTEGDVSIKNITGKNCYAVSCKALGIQQVPMLSPVQEYLDPERSNPQGPQRITAFDISPDSTRFATGFLDGSVFLYPVSPISSKSSESQPPIYPPERITPPVSTRAIARPHLSTITHLQFFPSSRVLLTAGADFSLAILPADISTPSATTTSASTSVRLTPARTLRAHTRPVTATAILGPGRNILSASLDGTLKLWDVPSSSLISTLPSSSSQPLLSAILGPGPSSSTYPNISITESLRDEKEVPEVHNSTVFGGLQDGSVQLFDLRSKQGILRTTPLKGTGSGGAAALAYSDRHHLLAVGSSRGRVSVYDVRTMSDGDPVTVFMRGQGEAGVEDLAFLAEEKEDGELELAVASADGLPYIAAVAPEGPAVKAELVGADCDPVRAVKARRENGEKWDIWSAGDDAVVRRWLI